MLRQRGFLSKLFESTGCLHTARRWCSTTQQNEGKNGKVKKYKYKHTKKRKIQKNECKEKTTNEINKIQEVVLQFPKSVWSRQRQMKNCYVVDSGVAEEIAEHICENDKSVYTLEANPGPGILTKALLEAGVLYLRVFEEDKAFSENLERLSENHPSLEINKKDILLLTGSGNVHFSTYFAKIDKKVWTEGIPLKLFFVVQSARSINFMRYLFVKLAAMTSLFRYGRCQIFLLMSDKEYSHFSAKPKENFRQYRSSSVLYNLFYDSVYLKKYPMSSFYPDRKCKKSVHGSHMHLIKLTPKLDLTETVASAEMLPDLYFFIWHHMNKRKGPVIRTLEQWVPFCGPKFIKKGMHVFTKFGDLSPSQLLQLFHQFSKLPEYKGSTFHEAAKAAFQDKEL